MKPKTLFLILLSLFLTFSCVIKTKVKIGNNTETYHQIDKVVHHKSGETLTYEIDTKIKHFNDSMRLNMRILGLKKYIGVRDEIEFFFFSSDSFLLYNLRKELNPSYIHKWENSDGSVDSIWSLVVELSKEVYNEIDYWIVDFKNTP